MASTKSGTAVVACPKCGSHLTVPLSMVGQRARCASCESPFTVPAPAENKNSAAKSPKQMQEPPAEVPVHVGFDCRVCNTRMFARTEDVGKKLKCPDCGALTVIPPPPKPKPKNMPAALEGEQYELWETDNQPLPSKLIAAQPKYVAVKCRKCDTVMYPTVKQVGQQIACPDCGTKTVVPPPPKPVLKPSVLAPDSLTPILDPAAHPGERPLVLPPSAKMLHEDRQEEEYRWALEKSRRTGKPMEIDDRGRPVMPRWPLISGVLPFLFTRGVPLIWFTASLVFTAAVWLLLTGIGMSNSGMGAASGLWLIAMACALAMLGAAGFYSSLLQIVMDSSEGNREVYHWPPILDWLGALLYLGVAGPFSAVPGYALAHIPAVAADPLLFALAIAGSVLICLPIIMLSQLDINSPAGILSGRMLASIAQCPFSWMFFCLENAVLAAICGAATYVVIMNHPDAALWLTFLYVADLILFARLLGRLAWRLADAMLTESE